MKLRNKLGLVLVGFVLAVSLLTFQTLLSIEAHRDLTAQLGQLNAAEALLELGWSDLARSAALGDPAALPAELARFRSTVVRAGRLSGNRGVARQIAAVLDPLLEPPEMEDAGHALLTSRITSLRQGVRAKIEATFREVTARANERIRSRRNFIIALLLLPTASLVLVAQVFHTLVTRRIETLSQAAVDLADNGGTLVVETGSKDEIGDLARSLDSMAFALAEKLKAEEELRARLVQEERLAVLGELAASIAHSLGNPVASIRAAAEVGGAAPDAPEEFGQILRAADRLSGHVEEVMRAARAGEARREPLHVNAALQGACALLRPLATKQDVYFDLRLADALPPLEGDPTELERAMLATLENAVEASPAGSVIHLVSEEAQGGVRVSVTDEGAGIPTEDLERVFDRFYTTKARGTGLGLATALRATENLGGTVSAERVSPKGTHIQFFFPVG